jgi:pimeloyl-ACP methyl ester carboxylesterase
MASKKEPIILLHGALGSEEQMKPLGQLLADTFDVHYLTYKGHDGKNPGKYNFSIEFFSNDVVNYMREHKLHKASLIGYSMGGYVALFLARYQPELVNRVVTIGTKLSWSPPLAAVEISKLNADTITEKWPHYAEELQRLHGAKNWKVVLQNTADMMYQMGQHAPLTDYDLSRLSQIVLLTTGEKDDAATPEEMIKYGQSMPKGLPHVFPGMPHPLHKMDIAVVAQKCREFLTSPVHEFSF